MPMEGTKQGKIIRQRETLGCDTSPLDSSSEAGVALQSLPGCSASETWALTSLDQSRRWPREGAVDLVRLLCLVEVNPVEQSAGSECSPQLGTTSCISAAINEDAGAGHGGWGHLPVKEVET